MNRRCLPRRAVLGLALGAGLARIAAASAGEPVSAVRLGLIVPSRARAGPRALVKELNKLGWDEGRNLQIGYLKLIGADRGRLPALASQLIGRGADAILAGGTCRSSWSRSIPTRWHTAMSRALRGPVGMLPASFSSRSS